MSTQSPEEEARSAADFLFSLMEQAWNSADVEAYAQLYSNDIGYVNRYGALFQGRAEVARIHAEALAGRFKNTKLRLATRNFRLLAPGVALAHVNVITSAADLGSPELRAIATVMLAKDDSGWHIAALHVSETTPAQ